MRAIDWDRREDAAWKQPVDRPNIRRGIGFAMAMHGTAIPFLDMGGCSIKLNDDGSFNMLVGATDLGTGADTVLGQIAAEVLGVALDDIIVYSSDTDMTPFDTGAYASVGAKVLERAAGHGCGPYKVPNVDIEATAASTNNPPCGAMRGHGVPQPRFAFESP